MTNKIFSPKSFALCIGVFVISLAASYLVTAWIEPSATPTGGSINAPINTGSSTQTKSGGLNISGNMGIGNTSPTQQLDVNGRVKTRTGFCIGDDCCDTWEECVNLGGGGGGVNGGCLANETACYGDTQCCSGACISSICKPSGSGILPRSACVGSLPAGYKRIFITRDAFTGNQIANENDADTKCQTAAQYANMENYGKFKALVYWGKRDINNVITANALFIGRKVGTTDQCDWYRVSDGGNDIFTLGTGTASDTNKGNGNYVWSKLQYNEYGELSTGGNYWTGFKPNTALDGSYSLIAAYNSCSLTGAWYTGANYDTSTYPCYSSYGSCPGSMGGAYACCWRGVHWYGLSSETGINWSGKVFEDKNSNALSVCKSSSHSLICVEGN